MAGTGTSNEQQFLCPECSKIFRDEFELLAHVLNHPQEEEFSCKLCEEKFDHEGPVFEHFIAHEEGFLTECNVDKDNALTIEDDFKKVLGLVSPCVAKADFQLEENIHESKEPYSVVKREIALDQEQLVKDISINTGNKSSTEKTDGLTCIEDEISLAINSAFEEGDHSEHFFAKAKDLQNRASKKHFLTNDRQEVSLTIDNASIEGKCKEHSVKKATKLFQLQAQNDAFERPALKIAKRMLPTRATFMCEVCGEKFDRKDQIEAHSLNHSVDVSYVCGICNEQYAEKTKLEKHFLTHTKEEGQIYESSYAMELLKKHLKRGPFTCKTCQISFFEKHQLESHSLTHEVSMLHVCKVCFKGFKNEQSLEQHLLFHIKNKFTCQMCFDSFETRRQLIEHFVTHVRKTDAPFVCRVCSKKFPTKRQLQKHFHTHMDTGPHKCRVCNKIFAKWSYLVTHMGVHTRHHVCDVCGISFTQKSFLRLHRFAHSQDCETKVQMQSVIGYQSALNVEKECSRVPEASSEPHPAKSFNRCEICHKVFNTKKDLLQHCLSHGGQRFTCGVCGNFFSHAANLRSHFVIHEAAKKFECLVCGKKFGRKQELTSHSVTHTREKNFVCGTCGKAFMRHNNLKQHCLSHRDDGILYRKNLNKMF